MNNKPKQTLRGAMRENKKAKDGYTQLAQAITHIMVANRAMLHIMLDHGLVTVKEFNDHMSEAEVLTMQNQRIGIRLAAPKSRWARVKRFFSGAFRGQPHKKVTPEVPKAPVPQTMPTPQEPQPEETTN